MISHFIHFYVSYNFRFVCCHLTIISYKHQTLSFMLSREWLTKKSWKLLWVLNEGIIGTGKRIPTLTPSFLLCDTCLLQMKFGAFQWSSSHLKTTQSWFNEGILLSGKLARNYLYSIYLNVVINIYNIFSHFFKQTNLYY